MTQAHGVRTAIIDGPTDSFRPDCGEDRQAICEAFGVIHRQVSSSGKGWFLGPWDSDVPVALGYADVGVDDPHTHDRMFEIYLVASGESTAIVNGRAVSLVAGDVLVVEPGDHHTFTGSSDDYLHFVVQTPFVRGDKRG